jgi:hypothetical protein
MSYKIASGLQALQLREPQRPSEHLGTHAAQTLRRMLTVGESLVSFRSMERKHSIY